MDRGHCRHRSLISVKDLDKFEKKRAGRDTLAAPRNAEQADERMNGRQIRHVVMIFLLFLAEAVMAASLASQIDVLVPSSASNCAATDSSFLRSVLQCSYFFGSTAGVLWGAATDRLGRRRVALIGLVGMLACCLSMGLATGLTTLVVLRCMTGALGSAATVSGLAMLADLTHGSRRRTTLVAILPWISACGQLGRLMASNIHRLAVTLPTDAFATYPNLAGQLAYAVILLVIALVGTFLLPQTVSETSGKQIVKERHSESEKAAFLGQSIANDSNESLNITIIEALNDDAAPLPSRIGVSQMITAPSVRVLLASYSVLSLHSATFDILLPHIGHTPTHNAGMGIPCAWLGPAMLAVQFLAAWLVMHFLPTIVSRVGLLPSYRQISFVFPALYIIIPCVALTVHTLGTADLLSATISTLATLAQTTFADAAGVLILLLVLSAAPDAASTGTLVGVISIAQLFKALAVGLVGMSYYLSEDTLLLALNGLFWVCIALAALAGAAITGRLRETPRVGTDIPQECLVWRGFFDVESDDDAES